jgi:hypothetical protein
VLPFVLGLSAALGLVNWRYQAWLLKNSFSQKLRKLLLCVRMTYERLSRCFTTQLRNAISASDSLGESLQQSLDIRHVVEHRRRNSDVSL